jgi:glycosyltransferase involved in cell wall biosynthesis
MHIAFITGNYPTPSRPETGTFVQQFVWAMARQGNECSVINPASVFDRRYGPYPPRQAVEDAGGGAHVQVYRPRYISFSGRSLGWIHTGRWTQRSLNRVARRAVAALPAPPEVVYGHFLYHAGYSALIVAQSNGCPAVVGVGEDHLWTLEAYGPHRAKRHWASGGAFLANSTPNRESLINTLGISPSRILVEPNGVDLSRMYPRNQQAVRRSQGLVTKEFLVALVGANEVRKGPWRVVEAIEHLRGVKIVLAGRGTEAVQSDVVIRSGPVRHEVVPELLCCADLFVLPTTSEGSCNAVIEAMACGLPIVTSRGRYMDDIVDDEVAIRVDPMDVRAIRDAVLSLKNDPERRARMSAACLRKAKRFDIDDRARRVTEWMEELVRTHQA